VLYDPDPFSSGNNERIPAGLETQEWPMPLNFRVGIAYRPIESESHSFLVAVDAIVPADNFESVNIGGEYVFSGLLALRGGYKSLFLQDSEESFTLGVGLMQRLVGNLGLRIDYAYQDFGRLKSIQKFDLMVTF
jgi:hypothetical protein